MNEYIVTVYSDVDSRKLYSTTSVNKKTYRTTKEEKNQPERDQFRHAIPKNPLSYAADANAMGTI
jgi:hypothetical protein